MKKEEIIDKAEEFVKCLYYPVARSKKEAVQLIIDFYDSIASELSGQEDKSENTFLNAYEWLKDKNIPSDVDRGYIARWMFDYTSQFQQEDKVNDEWTDADTDHAITGN